MVWPFKIFQNLLTGKMAINISALPHLSIPFERIWKVEKLGYDKGMFVQRVVSPFKTFHTCRSLLSDSFLTFQNPSV